MVERETFICNKCLHAINQVEVLLEKARANKNEVYITKAKSRD